MVLGSRHLVWLEQAIAGDRAAVKLLLTEIQPRLVAYISRKLPSDVARVTGVDDVLLETHLEIFRLISTFEPRGPDSFYRWVATIALNRTRNAVKRQRAAKRGGGRQAGKPIADNANASTLGLWGMIAGNQSTPSRIVAKGEIVQAVDSALLRLPDHYREAIRLVHLKGCPVKDAAARMQISERAVHGLCRRGLKLLQADLGSMTRYF